MTPKNMTLVWSFATQANAIEAERAIRETMTYQSFATDVDLATNNLYIEREAAYPSATMRTAYCAGICRGVAFAMKDGSVTE